MHRLVIVAGPNRGSSFSLVDGENSIGRQMDNHIVLTSSKVSKRHCALLVTPNEVLLRDEGSTNGTFVNGALAKRIPMKHGDKLGVGEFVLELVRAGGNEIAINTNQSNVVHMANYGMPAAVPETPAPTPFQSAPVAQEEPQDLPGKLKFAFENKVMPQFYGMLMKSEYRGIVAGLFCVMIGAAVIGSAMPIQDLAEQAIKREALIRAKVLCREIADRFGPNIAGHTESNIDLSILQNEESVKLAVLTNMNLQIIAPQQRLNQLFAGGREATYTMVMAKEFREGRERGSGVFVDDHTSVWVEPIKTMDPRLGRNEVAAMAIVAIDFSQNLLETGGLGVAYGTGFVIAGLVAFFVYFVVMRLTMKPYEVLNDDLDQVLRGEINRVTHEFQIEETDKLWDNINAAAQRLPKGGGESQDPLSVNWMTEFSPTSAIADASNLGLVGFDPNLVVIVMNAKFEEMSGIRADTVGQTLNVIARDQAFVSLVEDLKNKVRNSPSRSATDEFEFTGVAYSVVAVGVGPPAEPGLAVTFKKKE